MGKEYAQKFLAKFSRLFRASGRWAQAPASLLAWCFDHISPLVQRFETLTAIVCQRDCRPALATVCEKLSHSGCELCD